MILIINNNKLYSSFETDRCYRLQAAKGISVNIQEGDKLSISMSRNSRTSAITNKAKTFANEAGGGGNNTIGNIILMCQRMTRCNRRSFQKIIPDQGCL